MKTILLCECSGPSFDVPTTLFGSPHTTPEDSLLQYMLATDLLLGKNERLFEQFGKPAETS